MKPHIKKIYSLISLFSLLLTLAYSPSTSSASVPQLVTFAATITNSNGSPITSQVNLTFKIYDQLIGGSPLWTESISNYTPTNGQIVASLGSSTPLGTLNFAVPLYLGLEINSDGEMTPRSALTSVPYAFRADQSYGVVTGSATPTTATAGQLFYDTTLNQLYYRTNLTWVPVGSSLGGITSLSGLSSGNQSFANDTNITIASAGSTHTLGFTGQLSVARGGTGGGSFTSGGILVGNGTGTVLSLTAPTSGQIMIGSSLGQPSFVSLTGDGTLTSSGVFSLQNGSVSSAKIADATIMDGDISASAAIAYGKLNLTNSLINADISSAAAIAYSKLNLSNALVNGDISASAAIAYSKLNLANSLQNADISSSAAITYSKLSLANSITNSDISSTAAVSYGKLNLANSIQNADISSSAAIAYSKLNLSSSITNNDIANAAAIGYAKLNLSGSLLNSDIAPNAALALSKLATGSSGQIVVLNAVGSATYVTVSGDVAVASSGVITIQPDSVALGTDTTGNYVASVIGGSGISVSGSGENASVTVSLNTSSSYTWGGTQTFTNQTVTATSTVGGLSAVNTLTTNLQVAGTATLPRGTSFNSVNYFWPSSGGSNGQALTSDGSGNLTWATLSGSGSSTGITSLNGLSSQIQTFSNDANITITSTGSTHSLGFSGQLPVSRGGTGAGSFTSGGLLYGNGSSTLQATSAPSAAQVLVGSVSGTPAFVSLQGDVMLTATGSTTIGMDAITSAKILDNTISNSDISSSASIAYSKLNLSNSITAADIISGAAIPYAKLSLSGSITNSDIASNAAIIYGKLSLANSIQNADIASSAGIALSKLAVGTPGQLLVVSSTGSATYASVSGDAAISSTGALTLSNSGVTPGSYGGSSIVPVITVDSKGRVTTIGTASLPVQNSGGIASFNGLSVATQTFVVDASGSTVAIDSAGSTHILHVPDAGSSARGVVGTSTQTFSGDKTFTGTTSLNGGLLASGKQVVDANGQVTSIQFSVVSGDGSNYYFDLDNNGSGESADPTLTLVRGQTYRFNVSASGHPFRIENTDGSSYTSGLSNNAVDSGVVVFTVPFNAPNTLRYECDFHGSMLGVINILSAGAQTLISDSDNNTKIEVESTPNDNTIRFTTNGVSAASFDPTGVFQVNGTASVTTLLSATASAANLTVTATATLSGLKINGVNYFWPNSSGSSGQVLSSNGTGGLSWSTLPVGVASLNGLTVATQTFANDTNITISSTGSTHTLGFTGQLAVTRGGTGASSFTSGAVLYGNGSGAISATSAAQSGQILIGNGSVPTFVSLSGDLSINSMGTVTLANSGAVSGTYGSGTVVPVLTIDAKGRITSVGTAAVPAGSQGTGIASLNGLVVATQTFTSNSSGTDFLISSSGSTHIFSLPDASVSARGVVATGTQTFGGYKTFANQALFQSPVTFNGNIFANGTSTFASGTVFNTLPYYWPTLQGTNGQVLTNNGSGGLSWATLSSTGSGSISLGLAADSGLSQTIQSVGTFTIQGGIGINTVGTATNTVTVNFDSTEVSTTTFGTSTSFTWSFTNGSSAPRLGFTSGAVSLQDNADLRLSDGSNSYYVSLKSSAALSAQYDIVLPENQGSAGETLVNDGEGNLSWQKVFINSGDENADVIQTGTDGIDFVFTTDGLERLRITNDGNVGIGTNNPTTTLYIATATASTSVATFQNGTGNCSINPTTTSLSCSSDRTLKKDIVTINGTQTLRDILKLNPVTFKWNAEVGSETHSGFIAQEVEEVFPGLVSTDANGLKAVNYIGFAPYIVSALQEQQKKLNTLLGENDSVSGLEVLYGSPKVLISRLSLLENRVGSLELEVQKLREEVSLLKGSQSPKSEYIVGPAPTQNLSTGTDEQSPGKGLGETGSATTQSPDETLPEQE